MIGIVIYALFVFWSCGVISVLIDIDHIFAVVGRKPPFKLSDSYGRPLHSRAIFTLAAFGISIFMATFIDGLYRGILQGIGEGSALLLMIFLCFITGFITYSVGKKIGTKLKLQRGTWRREKRFCLDM